MEIKLKDKAEAEGVDEDVQQLPMVLDVNLQFEPIHTFAPQTGNQPYFTNNVDDPFVQDSVNELTPLGMDTFAKADFTDLEIANTGKIAELNRNSKGKTKRQQRRINRKLKNGKLSVDEWRRKTLDI